MSPEGTKETNRSIAGAHNGLILPLEPSLIVSERANEAQPVQTEGIQNGTRSAIVRKFLNGKTGATKAVELLEHAVRKFADAVRRLQEADPSIRLENLTAGNPTIFGVLPADFAQEILEKKVPDSYGYAYSLGEKKARIQLADLHSIWTPEAPPISHDKILVTNGVAHAIGMIIELLHAIYHMTILVSDPVYPSFDAIAGLHLKQRPPRFALDPKNNWEIDLNSLEEQLSTHENIGAILLIHPNNPTGRMYSAETLKQVVELAKKHGKFIICDEIYFQLIRSNKKFQHVIPIANEAGVPLLVLRGASKDVPAPGHRFGWVQAHGTEDQPEFAELWKALQGRMKAEVAAGTLPQITMPEIYTDPRFDKEWMPTYNAETETIVDDFCRMLSKAPGIRVTKPDASFYILVTFEEGVLKPGQKLPTRLGNGHFQKIIQERLSSPSLPADEHFVWSMMGNNGIATIPASGFSAPPGFRITALIRDREKREQIAEAIVQAITEYTASV